MGVMDRRRRTGLWIVSNRELASNQSDVADETAPDV